MAASAIDSAIASCGSLCHDDSSSSSSASSIVCKYFSNCSSNTTHPTHSTPSGASCRISSLAATSRLCHEVTLLLSIAHPSRRETRHRQHQPSVRFNHALQLIAVDIIDFGHHLRSRYAILLANQDEGHIVQVLTVQLDDDLADPGPGQGGRDGKHQTPQRLVIRGQGDKILGPNHQPQHPTAPNLVKDGLRNQFAVVHVALLCCGEALRFTTILR